MTRYQTEKNQETSATEPKQAVLITITRGKGDFTLTLEEQ